MKTVVFVLMGLAVFLLFFGCTQTNSNSTNNPKELLATLAERENSLTSFYASYDSNVFSSNGVAGFLTVGEVSKKDSDWKYSSISVTKQNNLSITSTLSTFILGNKATTCNVTQVNSSPAQVICSSNQNIQSGAATIIPRNLSLLLEKDFNFNGEQKISDKFSCYDFSFDLNMQEYGALFSANSGSIPGSANQLPQNYDEALKNFRTAYEVCLDKSTGFVDMAKTTSYITARPAGTPDNFPVGVYQGSTYSLKEYQPVVSDKDFEIPESTSK